MKFVQTISFTTARMDEMQALMDAFDNEPGSRAGFLGAKVLKDRDRENTYVVVAEFETYELAMENSARPETDAFAKQMAELSDGSPTFANYDLIHEDSA
jgi:quinol monooxygenase YgiN